MGSVELLIGTIAGGICTYYGYYYGYYYLKNKLTTYVLTQVQDKLNEMQEKEDVSFHPSEKSKSAIVLFMDGGKQHKLTVPYDRSRGRSMARKNVYLVLDNDNKKDITHKQGVPYLLSAKQMGGHKIVVEKDNKVIREYSEDEIPNYLD